MREMVPIATKMCLNIEDTPVLEATTSDSWHLVLVQKLFHGLYDTHLKTLRGHMAIDATLKPIVGLSALTCEWNGGYKHTGRLMQANSQTLRYLNIFYRHYADIGLQVLSEDAKLVTYPHIQTLIMRDDKGCSFPLVEPIEKGTPFPRLETLELRMCYPYTDDIMLRGNNATLESLIINVTDMVIPMFKRCNGPLRRKFGKMKRLSLLGLTPISDDNEGRLNEFVVIINHAPNIKHLYIDDSDISASLILALSTKKNIVSRTRIQHLSSLRLTEQNLTLSDVVCLLRGIPSLELLQNKISGLGKGFQYNTASALARHINRTYNPLSYNLCKWSILNTEAFSVNHVVACVLVVASVCPKLSLVDFRPDLDVDPKTILDVLLGCSLYGQYKASLGFAPADESGISWDVVRYQKKGLDLLI
ncbi:hypothetical protein GGF46_004270 [Coemansia sp. RSA 552]|nr:hypothetical protein GGF46_004270 [Coemansia sp. RSA 552]